ncbi:MAG: 23S rRNA (adenine(2503)-C(2))-methyltransferase RlmN [Saprospiraceae bacterium]
MELVKTDIRKLSRDEIKDYLIEIKESAFRAKQIYSWLWQKSIVSIDEMTNLSKTLRDKLNTDFEIRALKEDVVQKSNDGTIKIRYQLYDGHFIEAVLIPVEKDKRFTVCVSSQVGCSLTCKFCATGQMKQLRNLDPGEIYDQVAMVDKLCMDTYGLPLTNIVYMGMGEPLLAYKNVMKSIEHISSPEGLHMSARRITISTAGIAKMIKKLADDASKVNLALSLHAADDDKRNEIMPINEHNNLAAIMDALRYYYQVTKNRISYEYIAFQNFNDGIDDARNLVKLCKHFPVRVNIIEYNPIDGVDFVKADADKIDKFAQHLKDYGITCTIRRSRGKDIDAACGQLANKG